MLRSLKTPTLFIILLLAVLSVLTFNYWGLAQNNVRLRDSLISVQNRLNESNDKKANVEKQVNLNTQEIDQLKVEIADKNKALDQKGKDIETLNNKLKEVKQEKDNLLVEVNDVKEKLVCVFFTSIQPKLYITGLLFLEQKRIRKGKSQM